MAQQLGPLAEAGTQSLEQKLREYSEHSDVRIRQYFKHIPPYLRDLLYEVSKKYVGIPGCYVQLAMQLLADVPHEVMFILLNYDDLLERALAEFDPALAIQSIDDYVASGRQATVVKVHGSIDWVTPTPNANSWQDSIASFDPVKRPEEIARVQLGTSISGAVHSERWVYPVLTAPLAGKGTEAFVCPENHSAALSEFLPDCRKYLFIGTSGLDDDLLDFMAARVPDPSMAHFVGSTDAKLVRQRIQDRVQSFQALSNDFGHHYTDGFRSYVASDDLQGFANRDV